MKALATLGLTALTIFASSVSGYALAIDPSITPNTTPVWIGDVNSNLNADQIEDVVGTSLDLTELYKKEVGGGEFGGFAGSYSTSFFNSPSDPSDAVIEYTGGLPISGFEELYLYVKDGEHDPAFYVFDISHWNGTDDLVLNGFWPNGGAISHVTILGGGTSTNVPDGGATMALLGLGLGAVGFVRRKLAV